MDVLSDLFKQFDWSKLAIIALFALPGFISLRIWSLIFPTSERPFKDQLLEAISFGVLNAIVGAPLFSLFAPEKPWTLYLLVVFTLVILPFFWPFLVKWIIKILRPANLFLVLSPSAWDDVFLRREFYFVIVHLSDGGRVGGYYGRNSFAGLHPISGHLYLEQLWYLNEEGKFVKPVPDSKGLVLRPDDYKYIELFSVPRENQNGN